MDALNIAENIKTLYFITLCNKHQLLQICEVSKDNLGPSQDGLQKYTKIVIFSSPRRSWGELMLYPRRRRPGLIKIFGEGPVSK